MAKSESQIALLTFYPEFPDDWKSLSNDEQVALASFLERLQRDPYDPEIVLKSESHGEYFAYHVTDKIAVIWKLRYGAPAVGLFAAPREIWVLAVENRPVTK